MGLTEFSGPVYGAIGILAIANLDPIGPSVTDSEIFQIDVPSDEDWYLTRVAAFCTDQGNAGAIDVEDDGASVLASSLVLVTGDSVEVAIVADSGEDMGKRVAAGSSLTVDATVGATTPATDVTVTIEGYKRKIGAPR